MPRRFLLPSALLAFACLARPAIADPAAPLPRPSNLRSDILYTHRGEFVQVKPMRALTLNAHVEQFAYDPLGLEIAVVGSEAQGDQTVHFIKTIDTRTGREISRYAVTGQTGDQGVDLTLLGWSTSGKYVLLRQLTHDPQTPETVTEDYLRWDLSASPPTTYTIDPEAALPANTQPDADGFEDGCVSADGRWMAFRQNYRTIGSDGKPGRLQTLYSLYDPEHGTFRTLPLPPRTILCSWSDATHLEIEQMGVLKQFDVVTGQISSLTTLSENAAPASKQYPDLTLDIDPQKLEDSKGGGGRIGINIIWIRRAPFGKMPLGVAAAGFLSSGNALHTDPEQIEWSPTGRQVAFLSNNELCVTDLIVATGAMPNEKLAVGQKLSCIDEQGLANTDLKQIGLALIQYLQDNDEKYPPSEGIRNTLIPFLQSINTSQTDVFQLDGHSFVYEQPAATLADMEAPAEIEMGYMDLPCARVVLMADGHVKSLPK